MHLVNILHTHKYVVKDIVKHVVFLTMLFVLNQPHKRICKGTP